MAKDSTDNRPLGTGDFARRYLHKSEAEFSAAMQLCNSGKSFNDVDFKGSYSPETYAAS